MKTWFVTRHKGAVLWAASKGIKVSNKGVVKSLNIDDVSAGDKVVGTLPINLAAAVLAKGAEYFHLALEVPDEARGAELTPGQMEQYGARIERYDILRKDPPPVAAAPADGNEIMIALVSDQTLPNIIPLLAQQRVDLHLVYTDTEASRAALARIRRVAKLLDIKVASHKSCSAPFQAVLADADKILRQIRNKHPGGQIVLNATGGTKMMSAAFATALGPAGRVIYCDTQNGRIEHMARDGAAPLPLQNDLLNLETFLLAQGLEIVRDNAKDPQWIEKIESRSALTYALVDGLRHSRFRAGIGSINYAAERAVTRDRKSNEVTGYFYRQTVNGHLDEALANLLLENGILVECEHFSEVDDHGHHRNKTRLCFPTGRTAQNIELVDYIKGLWLEEYCALEMQAIGLPVDHWGCGVKVRPIGAQLPEGDERFNSLNELDLAIAWQNRLLVIECKSGDIAIDSQNILNKLKTIKSYVAGALGEAWLLSAKGYGEGDATTIARARIEEYRIRVVEQRAVTRLRDHIEKWLGPR